MSRSPSDTHLTRDEQARLTAGIDMWHVPGVDRLDIAPMAVTDGPSGARGTQFTGSTSILMPCGTALASTWNPDLVREVGRVIGDDARAHGARVLLAPTVNIHRHPLAGRNFEAYSEDPHLNAEIAVGFIEGVQSRGVGCAVKHFVANDQETDRMNVDVVVDERALREIYLVPFEAAVRRAGVWAVMAAYNRVGGSFCSEHQALLTGVLRDEWGFDGVVMSDWFGTHSRAAIEAGLDLEMPGPAQVLGEHLLPALDAGEVAPASVERSAERVLGLLGRTTTSLGDPVDPESAGALSRRAATEAIVLLQNDGVLPIDPTTNRLAVLGPRARAPHVQGGGSAQVTPAYVVTPARGITERAAAAGATVTYEPGCVDRASTPVDHRYLAPEPDGAPGRVRVDYHGFGDLDGAPLRSDAVATTNLIWIGEPAPGVPANGFAARLTAAFLPDRSGLWTFGLSSGGAARLSIDAEAVADTTDATPGSGFMGLFSAAEPITRDLVAGTTYVLVAEVDVPPVSLASAADEAVAAAFSLAGLIVEATPPEEPDALGQAIAAVRDVEVAIVVVGHDAHETEGTDHAGIDLPADQVALIRQVAAANPATVVVVNTGSPVSTDWADDVAAVLQLSYGGQEAGAALAAVLFGDVDVSGRLPTTYPVRIEDSPAYPNFPGGDGTVRYEEGIFVGYRHYDTAGVAPRFCFGHGLSYTTFDYAAAAVEVDGHTARVSVDVTNTGARPGREVVQVYVRDVESTEPCPDRELTAFRKVALEPGETARVDLVLDERAFAHWDAEAHGWRVEPGDFEILIGSSSRAIHHTVPVRLA